MTKNCKCTKIGTPLKWLEYSFEQYQTVDALKRTISFFLCLATTDKKLPLVTFIGGSGGGSAFKKKGDEIVGTSRYPLYLEKIAGRAHFLVVEKPGVKLFEEPPQYGMAQGCSDEFLYEYTLDRWTEANSAAINAASTLPEIDEARILVVGHSDGGQVATHVAFMNPAITQVASLAGGGPTQLFDATYFRSVATAPEQMGSASSTQRIEQVLSEWAKIQADPDSISKFWMGHPYRRWSTFLRSSSLEDLLGCTARAYIVQGSEDTSVPVISFDVMRAELAARNRKVLAERIEGADHGLRIQTQAGVQDELPAVLERIMNWFLDKQELLEEAENPLDFGTSN